MNGIKWNFSDSIDKGGTTATGKVACELLHKQCHQEIIISEVPEWFRDVLGQYGQSLSVIIRVLSSKSQVNVKDLKIFCFEFIYFSSVAFCMSPKHIFLDLELA